MWTTKWQCGRQGREQGMSAMGDHASDTEGETTTSRARREHANGGTSNTTSNVSASVHETCVCPGTPVGLGGPSTR